MATVATLQNRVSRVSTEFASLDAAVAALGASNAVLTLAPGDTKTLTGDLTIPANVTLDARMGVIATNGHTLTVNGECPEVNYQVFDVSGGGSVAGLKTANPRMFGAGDAASAATNVTAIRAAITAAKAVKGEVYIPAGTYVINDSIEIDSTCNGLTIRMDGTLKYDTSLAAGTAPGWMIHLYDTTTPIQNVRITGGVLDGNRASLVYGSTSHGIVIGTDTTFEGVQIDNVTAHGFLGQGFQVFSGGVRLSNVYAYDNGGHGVGTSIGTTFNSVAEIYGATCWDNDGYGIDISKGKVVGDNWVTRGNTAGGIKYSENCEYLQVGSILTEDNAGPGFTNTGAAADMELYIDSIVTRNNDGYGLRATSGRRIYIGRVVSIDNDGALSGGVQGGDINITVPNFRVDSVYVEGATAHGVTLSSTTETWSIGHLEAIGCQKAGLYMPVSATNAYGSIGSGVFRNNNLSGGAGSTASVIQISSPGSVKVRGCILEDDQATPTQVSGLYFAGGVQAEVDQCHFGTGITAGGQIYSATTGTRVRFGPGNTGIVTRARGTFTDDGGSTGHTATFDTALTGLGGAVRYAQVTPASADAAIDHYISAVTASTVTVTYTVATTAGVGNVSYRYDVQMEVQR